MEATIDIKEYEVDDVDHEPYRTFFGGLKFREVNRGKKKYYVLNLTLNPSEEERAIILKYKLDELAVETALRYTPEYMADYEVRQRQLHSTISEETFQNI